MLYFEKSHPAPDCLIIEKNKTNGDYKCGKVLERIKDDFKNKCYICEFKEPTTINVEHFIPHEGNKDLEFDWNNLFYACGHCNNIKLAKFKNLINCTDQNQEIDKRIKYTFFPFPHERPKFFALDSNTETIETKNLLEDVFNGTTKLKILESSNLRNFLLKEIKDFQKNVCDYFDDSILEIDKDYFLIKIKSHLSKGSNFTSFKRWIVLENEVMKNEFEKYFD